MENKTNDTVVAVPTKAELSGQKKLALKRVEQLSGESEWNLLQQIIHDIEAFHVVKNDKRPSLDATIDLLKDEIKARYSADHPEQGEIRDVLLEAVPSRITLQKWRTRKGWDDAVWTKARGGPSGLFSHDKRSVVIHSLYDNAVKGNTTAAKIWLTLSGDYVEKSEAKNEIVDQFREINSILHGKK